MHRRTSKTTTAGWLTDLSPLTSSRISPSECDVRELVAIRAYELYLKRGRDGGDEVSDWMMAEAEVLSYLETNPLYEQPRVSRSVNGAKKGGKKPAVPSRARKPRGATSSRKNRPKSEAA